jgi:hypothetical protein
MCCWPGWASWGVVKPGGKQRTDSTHVISAVRDLKPVGAGRGVSTGAGRSPRGRRAGLAAHRDRRARGGAALWRPGRFLAAADLPGQTQAAGRCLGHRRPHAAARGVWPRRSGLAGGAARRGGIAHGAGAELPHPHRRPRAGGDQSAGGATQTVSRRANCGSAPRMTPIPAGPPRAKTSLGTATRSTSAKPATPRTPTPRTPLTTLKLGSSQTSRPGPRPTRCPI